MIHKQVVVSKHKLVSTFRRSKSDSSAGPRVRRNEYGSSRKHVKKAAFCPHQDCPNSDQMGRTVPSIPTRRPNYKSMYIFETASVV
jgi:hypothetical protein